MHAAPGAPVRVEDDIVSKSHVTGPAMRPHRPTPRRLASWAGGAIIARHRLARRLGCIDELRGVETILRYGPSYQRQRAVAGQRNGSLKAVASLIADMRDGIPRD